MPSLMKEIIFGQNTELKLMGPDSSRRECKYQEIPVISVMTITGLNLFQIIGKLSGIRPVIQGYDVFRFSEK